MDINPFGGGRYIHSASAPIYLYVHALITQRRAVYQKSKKRNANNFRAAYLAPTKGDKCSGAGAQWRKPVHMFFFWCKLAQTRFAKIRVSIAYLRECQ